MYNKSRALQHKACFVLGVFSLKLLLQHNHRESLVSALHMGYLVNHKYTVLTVQCLHVGLFSQLVGCSDFRVDLAFQLNIVNLEFVNPDFWPQIERTIRLIQLHKNIQYIQKKPSNYSDVTFCGRFPG